MSNLETNKTLEKLNQSPESIPKLNHDDYINLSEEIEAQRRKDKIISENIYKIGGIKAFKLYIKDNFILTSENKQAYEYIMNFDCKENNLYLWGGVGTGKTHLVSMLAHRFINDNFVVVKPPKIMRDFRLLEPYEERELLKKYLNYYLLIIDDLGIEKSTEFALQILYEIIDSRDMAMKNGLVITSNLSLDQLAEKTNNDRLASRIAGLCKVMQIKGNDMRLKKNV